MSSTDPRQLLVLYRDEHLVLVHKPPGMPVQPDETRDPSLLDLLRQQLAPDVPELVHRLDRPVSGLVLFALDRESLRIMNGQFRERQVVKHYHAIVEGKWAQGEVVLEHSLAHDQKARKARVVDQPSISKEDPSQPEAPADLKNDPVKLKVRPMVQGDRYTLVDVVPEGGAFHQIRAQLAAAGHPIKGDVKYGARRGERGPGAVAGSIALHAHSLAFHHPVTDTLVEVVAPTRGDGIWLPLLKLAAQAGGNN